MRNKWYKFLLGVLEGWDKLLNGFLFGVGFILALQVYVWVMNVWLR
jgi:hypothetical protein